jgi:AcrR family transcriptional regulator
LRNHRRRTRLASTGLARTQLAGYSPEKETISETLRERLVTAAVRMLERTPAAEISLRAIARDCGVSEAAPYRHFRDKNALLSAVAAVGFRMLGEAVSAWQAKDKSEVVQAFKRFADAHPHLYDVMHSIDPGADDSLPEHKREALATYLLLSEWLATHARQDPRLGDDPYALWAELHGRVMIERAGLRPP